MIWGFGTLFVDQSPSEFEYKACLRREYRDGGELLEGDTSSTPLLNGVMVLADYDDFTKYIKSIYFASKQKGVYEVFGYNQGKKSNHI